MKLQKSTWEYPQIVLVTSSLFHGVNDATLAILPGILPFLKDFNLSFFDVGLLYAAMLVVMIILQLVFGTLADKYDELDLLGAGAFIIFLTCMLLFNTMSYFELFVFNLIYAVGTSIYHPVSYAALSRAAPEETYRTKSMGISGSVGDFGNFIAFVSTGMIAGVMNWRFPFLVWGVFSLLVIGIYLIILRPKRRSLASTITSTDFNPNHGTLEGNGWNKRLVILIFTICILMGAMYRTFMNFTTLFLTQVIHVTPTDADLLFSLFVLAGVIGAFLSGYIAKYFGLRKAIIVEFLILTPSTLLLYFNFAQIVLIVTLLLIINGFVLYTTYPTIYSLVANTASFGGRGRSYGFAISITFIGGATISIIDGMLADLLLDPSIVYLLGAFIALCTAIIATFLPQNNTGPSVDLG